MHVHTWQRIKIVEKTVKPANEGDVPMTDMENSNTSRNDSFTSNILLLNIVKGTPLSVSLAKIHVKVRQNLKLAVCSSAFHR